MTSRGHTATFTAALHRIRLAAAVTDSNQSAILDQTTRFDPFLEPQLELLIKVYAVRQVDIVTAAYVLLDVFQIGAADLAKFLHRFDNQIDQIGALTNLERATFQLGHSFGVLVGTQPLVVNLKDRSFFDAQLQLVLDCIAAHLVELAHSIADPVNARPLFLVLDLADGVEEPLCVVWVRKPGLQGILSFSHHIWLQLNRNNSA